MLLLFRSLTVFLLFLYLSSQSVFSLELFEEKIPVSTFKLHGHQLEDNLIGAYKLNSETLESSFDQHAEISFTLSRDLKIEAALLKTEEDFFHGTQTWVGSVYGDNTGTVVLTKNVNGLSGEIRAFNQSYSIKKSTADAYLVKKNIDYQFEGNDIFIVNHWLHYQATRPRAVSNPPPVQSLANAPTTIDLMVLYTANALAASPSIVTDIANDIAYANTVLDRSCTKTRLRIVHTEQVAYDDSNVTASAALECIADPSDGCLDSIETLRDTHGADLIQLWSALPLTDACGIATLYHPSLGDRASYSLKVIDCSADTTTHEIGHNLGLYHDPYASGAKDHEVTDYTPGYGQVDLEARHRTIMSYASQCSAFGVSCPRIPYFSNPRILHKGKSLGAPQRKDSAYQIIKNKSSVAAIRNEATAADTPSFTLCEEVAADKDSIVEGCFIASWVYQDELAPDVIALRIFRDKFLAKSLPGRILISTYYQISPILIDFFETAIWIRPVLKSLIQLTVWSIQYAQYINFTLITLIFLSTLLFFRIMRGQKL